MGKMCEWGRVAMWERCVSGARWQGVKGGSFHSSIVHGDPHGNFTYSCPSDDDDDNDDDDELFLWYG